MGIIKSWDIRRLRPFRKVGESVPDPQEGQEELSNLDPSLRPDEEQYVRHYLAYADQLLKPEDELGREGMAEHRLSKLATMPEAKKDEAA